MREWLLNPALLIEEEHALTGEADEARAHRRRELEDELDQCWDLLRQRQARRAAAQDPEQAHERPVGTVEDYLQ